MTLVSLTDACRQLGIDPKTLRRWLADAHCALQGHPQDGRKHGVSAAHVQLLARLHQRSLAPLAGASPAPEAVEPVPLPAALLALPAHLSALQAQLTSMQQQVAALMSLLQQQAHPPGSPAPVAQPSTTRRRSSRSAPRAPRAHPAASANAKTPRKAVHVIPRVEYGPQGRYVVICPKRGLLPFEPESPEWFAWVAEQDSFRFVGPSGHFTAHHEWRVKHGAWRAHRHIRNRVYTLRLAPAQELTIAVLEQAALALQAHL